MSHYLTQPEEIDFVLMTMEQQGLELDMYVQQEGGRCYGTADSSVSYAAQSDLRGQRTNLT